MFVVGAVVEREAHQDAKPSFSEGAESSTFLEKTLFKHHTKVIGAGKGSNYQSYLALAALESRQPM